MRRSEARVERASDLYFLKLGAAVIPNRASVAQRGRELMLCVAHAVRARQSPTLLPPLAEELETLLELRNWHEELLFTEDALFL